jgi:hypothetical protein
MAFEVEYMNEAVPYRPAFESLRNRNRLHQRRFARGHALYCTPQFGILNLDHGSTLKVGRDSTYMLLETGGGAPPGW